MTYPYPYREAARAIREESTAPTPKHRGHTSENPRIGNVQCPGCEIVKVDVGPTTKCPRHAPGVYALRFAKHRGTPEKTLFNLPV